MDDMEGNLGRVRAQGVSGAEHADQCDRTLNTWRANMRFASTIREAVKYTGIGATLGMGAFALADSIHPRGIYGLYQDVSQALEMIGNYMP